jgi:DNA polymerase III subunit delta
MTALRAHEVARYLDRPDLAAGVFLVYGPDSGLVRETAQRLIRHYAGPDPDPMAQTSLDSAELDADPGRLAVEARTSSLFGGLRTIRIRAAGKSLTTSLSLLLEDMPDAVVVLEAGNLQRNDALRTLAETNKRARALPCYADDDRALSALIRTTLTEAGISSAPDVVPTLVGLLGSDREITRRELEKLVLYAGPQGNLTADDVIVLCGDNSGRALDAIVDAVAGGNAAACDTGFGAAVTSGADPQRILGMALGHFALLRRMRAETDAGRPIKSVMEALRPRPHFSRTAAIERQVRLWTDPALAAATNRLQGAILDSRRNARLAAPISQRALLALAVAAAQR